MKTFADFKRRLKVGLVLQCEHHERPEISGRREIVKVQSNAISYLFDHPENGERTGWAYFEKASRWRIAENSVTAIDEETGKAVFTYHFPPDA